MSENDVCMPIKWMVFLCFPDATSMVKIDDLGVLPAVV